MYKVSLVIPIYNTAAYLPACLSSIANQTHQNLEVILVDDGSTDNSGRIADDFAKQDHRFKAIHQKNSGQSAARNRGLEQATGDYIGFIDSDDVVNKTFVADLLAPMTNGAALSVCGIHYKRLHEQSAKDVYVSPLRPRGKRESFKSYILYLLAVDGRMYSSVNKLYRADLAKKCQFDPTLNFAEDTKFVLDYLKAASKGKNKTAKLAFILKPLYIYNYGTEGSTIRHTATDWRNWQQSYDNLREWVGPHPSIRESFWLHLVHLRWRISHRRSVRRAEQP